MLPLAAAIALVLSVSLVLGTAILTLSGIEHRGPLAAPVGFAALLVLAFAPVMLGQRHLMLSGWDVPSVTNAGAYDPIPRPLGVTRVVRTPDPGAPGWTMTARRWC